MVTPRLDTRPQRSGATAFFVIAILVNAGLWVAINVRPGWESISFLTPSFSEVLAVINLALILGVVVNALCVVIMQPWLRTLGRLLAALFGLLVAWRLYIVFPFEFDSLGDSVVRSVLIIAILGCSIGVVVEFVRLVRGAGA